MQKQKGCPFNGQPFLFLMCTIAWGARFGLVAFGCPQALVD